MATAAVLVLGGATTGALAQEPETPTSSIEPTPTSESSAPPTTEEPVPSSEPAPPSSTPTSEAPTTESSTPVPPAPQPENKPENKAENKAEPEQEAAQTPEVKSQSPRPDLSVSVGFGKAEYLPGEDLVITIKIRNVGDAVAKDVRLSLDRQDLTLKSGYDALLSRPTIAAGGEEVITIVAEVSYDRATNVSATLRATVDGVADATPGDNSGTGFTSIRRAYGSASGVLFVDKDGDGTPDADEALTGYSVLVEGGVPKTSRGNVPVDGQGRFSYTDLPVGDYRIVQLVGSQGNNHAVKPGISNFVVRKGEDTKLAVAAVKPVSDALEVQVAFDRDSYAKTDPVGISITLKNKSDVALTGVVAVCNPYTNDVPGLIEGIGKAWEQFNPDGPGVTVGAGKTEVFHVTDEVPADTLGQVTVACNFGNDGRNSFGYVGGSDWARVNGFRGTVRGNVVDASTGNPVERGRIVAIDPVTRRPVGDSQLGYQGQFETYDMRAGNTAFVVLGQWKPKDGKEFVFDVQADQTSTAPVFEVVPGPEVPDPSKVAPDIAVTAAFDKATYEGTELARVTVKVENKGTAAGYARFVDEMQKPQDHLRYDLRQWGDFSNYMKQVVLQPGESRVVVITGEISSYFLNTVSFSANIEIYNDSDQSNNKVQIKAGVHRLTGNVEVLAYGDKDGNGKYDSGEEFGDLDVTLAGVRTGLSRQERTDATGRARFDDVQIGTYYTYSQFPDGWVTVGYDSATGTISADATTVIELRAVRPLSDKFTATAKFGKAVYAAGEDYSIDLTLTNNSGAALEGVAAMCHDPGAVWAGPGWGDVREGGPGIRLEDGETRVIRVTGPQPEGAADAGFLGVSCDFGPRPSQTGYPTAVAWAQVPGKTAGAKGRLVHDDENDGSFEGDGVVKTAVVLVDRITKKVTARTISGDDGEFAFTNVPVGEYEPVVVGPWKARLYWSQYFRVSASSSDDVQVVVLEPGPEVEDPGYQLPEDQKPGTTAPPASVGGAGGAGDGTDDALAKTGASVLGLGLLGALLVAFGFGVNLIGRRRQIA
ncbi:hypothetical protein [Lentzea californiensis]|uniref:hypothetical protein n=1 Tax=Lentzea californiensis TaxID=438851 RepID=UPI002164E9F5|nr:hypothetical protein [Lentzea californiensis]